MPDKPAPKTRGCLNKNTMPEPIPGDVKTAANVTLPPIDATPEEIAQALFQRPPMNKPVGGDADAC